MTDQIRPQPGMFIPRKDHWILEHSPDPVKSNLIVSLIGKFFSMKPKLGPHDAMVPGGKL